MMHLERGIFPARDVPICHGASKSNCPGRNCFIFPFSVPFVQSEQCLKRLSFLGWLIRVLTMVPRVNTKDSSVMTTVSTLYS